MGWNDHVMGPGYEEGSICRLCGSEFTPEEEGQLYCSGECEHKDRKIDEAEIRREERQ